MRKLILLLLIFNSISLTDNKLLLQKKSFDSVYTKIDTNKSLKSVSEIRIVNADELINKKPWYMDFLPLFAALLPAGAAIFIGLMSLKRQTRIAIKQSFENQFFNLLSYQQKILNDIKANIKISGKETHCEGRDFFRSAKQLITNLYRYFNENSNTNQYQIRSKLPIYFNKYDEVFYKVIIDKCESLIEIMLIKKNPELLAKEVFNVFFIAYHNYYAHYFRNLARLFRYLNDSYKDKKIDMNELHKYYDYIEGSMSADELFCLFYNCLKFKDMKKLIDFLSDNESEKYSIFQNLDPTYLIKPEHQEFYPNQEFKNYL